MTSIITSKVLGVDSFSVFKNLLTKCIFSPTNKIVPVKGTLQCESGMIFYHDKRFDDLTSFQLIIRLVDETAYYKLIDHTKHIKIKYSNEKKDREAFIRECDKLFSNKIRKIYYKHKMSNIFFECYFKIAARKCIYTNPMVVEKLHKQFCIANNLIPISVLEQRRSRLRSANHQVLPSIELQSGIAETIGFKSTFDAQKLLMEAIPIYIKENLPWLLDTLENLGIFIYKLTQVKSLSDLLELGVIFVKIVCKKSIIMLSLDLKNKLNSLFSDALGINLDGVSITQQNNQIIDDCRFYLESYDMFKNSLFYKKMYKICMYGLSLNIFKHFGVTMNTLNYDYLEQQAIKRKYYCGPDMFRGIMDTVLFVLEKGKQCLAFGSIMPFLHEEKAYEIWFKLCQEIELKAPHLANPEVHGFDRYKFVADLKDAIERGQAIYDYTNFDSPAEKRFVGSVLFKMKSIEKNELTKRAAQKERKAPFAVLIQGTSSVAKSTFTKILFYHFGKMFGLQTASEYKYTRNPAEEYWSNFNSTQWCVQMDDIAFLNPKVAQGGGDASVTEILQVINNVPYVPAQAELSDKGRTPVLAKLVLATTNTKHLNAQYYFACPLAIQRRFPFVISIQPKKEYIKNEYFIDSANLPMNDLGYYPDYWIITVSEVIPGADPNQAQLKEIQVYDDIYVFISWFSQTVMKYETTQSKVLQSDTNMSKIVLCKQCFVPMVKCRCIFEQSNSAEDIISDTTNTIIQTTVASFTFIGILRWFMNNYLLVVITYFLSQLRAACGCYITYQRNRCITRIIRTMRRNVAEDPMLQASRLIRSNLPMIFGIYAAYKMYKKLTHKEPIKCEARSEEVGEAPVATLNERTNNWLEKPYCVSKFDISAATSSFKGLHDDVFLNKIKNNLVRLEFLYETEEAFKKISTPSFCLFGNIYVINIHTIANILDYDLTVKILMDDNANCTTVNMNTHSKIDKSKFKFCTQNDILFFEIPNIPPKANISKFLVTDNYNGKVDGLYLMRDRNGAIRENKIYNLQKKNSVHNDITYAWEGYASDKTVNGDCASICISFTPTGPIILGMHSAGAIDPANKYVLCSGLTSELVNNYYPDIKDRLGGGVPMLETNTIKRNLSEVHHKSIILQSEKGTGKIYGSYLGFRPKHKTSVELSLMCEDMIMDKYTITHAAPLMSGKLPWEHAFK
jgi:hypothetical protein